MADGDVPHLLQSLQYRVKGESGCWKSRCYGPLLQLQDRRERWRKRHRGEGTASLGKGDDSAQDKDPMHSLYACSLKLRESQRENDADDLEAMAHELLGVVEGSWKGLAAKPRVFPSVAVITLLTHLAQLDHLSGSDVVDISELSPRFTDGQVEPVLPPDTQLQVVRRRAEAIHPKSFFQADRGGGGFTFPMDLKEHATASGLLDDAWTNPLRDTTLFSSLRARGGLFRRGLEDLSLRLTLPMPSVEEEEQPFPDCADALLRGLDKDNARPRTYLCHGLETSKHRDSMDESSSRVENEELLGSGAIVAVQEEGDAGLGCVGWEASCQYHRKDPSLWPALAPPKVPPLLTQDGVEGFESVIPAFLEQDGEDVLVVDERTLVEQCLLALRAIPSDAFTLDRVTWRVCPTATQIRVPGTDSGSIRRLMHHFAMAGTCFFRLESLIDETLKEQEGRGQVLQAFMHALHEQLALHHAHLNDIDDLLLSASQDLTTAEPLKQWKRGPSCLLTTSSPSPPSAETHKAAQTFRATLLRAISCSRSLRARIRFLASLCQCLPADEEESRVKRRQPWTPAHALLHFPAGSALLSHLFRACRHAQASCPSTATGAPRGLHNTWKRQRSAGEQEGGVGDSTYATVRWLFHRAAAPYLALLAKWLYQGWVDEADDPAGEFVLHCRRSWHLDMGSGTSFLTNHFHSPPPLLMGHVGLTRQSPTLPAFFTPALAKRIVLAGKLLHLLSLAHSPFYHSCALQPAPLLGVVGSSAGSTRAPSRVEGLVDDLRREEDAKLQEERRRRVAAREKEREIVRQLEAEMLRRVEEAQGKKYEQRRVLLAQIREKELEKGEQRRLEISEYKEEERRRSEEEKAELRKAQEELQAKYAVLVAEAEKRVALALWRSERIDRKRAAREALRSRLLDDERQWALERGQAFEPTTSMGADLDVHAPLSPTTTASLPSPPSLLPSPSAADGRPSPSDRPLSSFSTYTAASDLTEASFSGIRVSQAPGGGSSQVAALLTSPSPTTTASLSSHTIAGEPENLPRHSPSHEGHEEPSFSGIRVRQAPGGGSAQVTGIFAGDKHGPQDANLPRGNQHNEESRDSSLHEEVVGRERRSSFSGIRVSQQPGGSSAHVAGILGGNRPGEESQERVDERWHPQESERRGARASPAHGLQATAVAEEEQAPSAFFMHDEGDADAAAFFTHDDEAAKFDRLDEHETARAAYPTRSTDNISAIESPPRARPPTSPSPLQEALVAESRSRGSTPTATEGASAGANPQAAADVRGAAVLSPLHEPQRPEGTGQQSHSEEGRQRRRSLSGIRVSQQPGGHSNQVAALLSDEVTQERAPSRLSNSSPSFSGKHIVQPPGGSSAHVANLLWGQEGTEGQPLQRLHHHVDAPTPVDEGGDSEVALNAAKREEGHKQRREKEAQERNAMMTWRCDGVKARLADCDLLDRSLAICHMLPPQDHSSLPLEVVWQDTVGHLVEEQCHRVEKAALAFLIHEANVVAHLHSLRTYLLGSETTVVRDFVRTLQSRWERMHALEWTRPSNALYCFNEAAGVAGLEHDPRRQHFTYILGMQQVPASSQLDLIDSLQPCYTPPWPLGLVVTEAALHKYYTLHRLLLRLHWTAGLVQRCFAQLRAVDKARENGEARRVRKVSSTRVEEGLAFRSAYVLLHALAALANAVLEHVVTQVEGECWGAFRSALQDCERGESGVMPLRYAHEAYVTEVASRCFIGSEEEIDDWLRELGPWICKACLTIETVIMSPQASPTLEDGTGLAEQTDRLKMEMGQRLLTMQAALGQARRSAHYSSVKRAKARDYLDALDSRIAAMISPLT